MFVTGIEIAAVLFDLDNTLVDRDEAVRYLGRKLFREVGVSESSITEVRFIDDFVRIDAGGSVPDKRSQMATVASELSTLVDDCDQLLDWWNREYSKAFSLDRPSRLTLDRLDELNVPWGIVTNGSPLQQTVVESLGLHQQASAVVVSSLVELRKPDRRIFELAAALVSGEIAVGKFLFVGDNPTADIVGASEAGMKAAWVSRGRSWAVSDNKPDVVIESVGDLVRMIST